MSYVSFMVVLLHAFLHEHFLFFTYLSYHTIRTPSTSCTSPSSLSRQAAPSHTSKSTHAHQKVFTGHSHNTLSYLLDVHQFCHGLVSFFLLFLWTEHFTRHFISLSHNDARGSSSSLVCLLHIYIISCVILTCSCCVFWFSTISHFSSSCCLPSILSSSFSFWRQDSYSTMWWINSLCIPTNEDLGTSAEYDLSQILSPKTTTSRRPLSRTFRKLLARLGLWIRLTSSTMMSPSE